MSSMKMMVLVVVSGLLVLAGSAQAALLETFDSYAGGSNLHGQGARPWGVLSNEGGITLNPRILAGGGFGGTTGAETASPGLKAGATVDVVSDFAASTSGGGSYTASFDFFQRTPQTTTNLGQAQLFVGDTASMTTDTGGNHNQFWVQISGTGAIGYHNRVGGSVRTAAGGSSSYDRDTHGWIRLEMEVNAANTSATASVIDIDDNTGAEISTIDSHTFSGSTFGAVERAGFTHNNQGWGAVDNFASSPEPTTALMLVLGGGLLLRRRRAA